MDGAPNVVRRHKLRIHVMSALLATQIAAFHGDGSTPSWREGQALLHAGSHRGSIHRMKPLEAPDSHYLKAAEGWLEFGNLDQDPMTVSVDGEKVLHSEFHPMPNSSSERGRGIEQRDAASAPCKRAEET